MPKLFSILGYNIFFWSNENGEPIHVNVCKGKAHKDATKIWVIQKGVVTPQHNKSDIPKSDFKKILQFISDNSDEIIEKWNQFFNI